MVTPCCVKVTCLPEGSSNDELATRFGLERDVIDVPKNQQGPNYYAWVNGFSTKQDANNFVRKWNNQRIRSGTITCKIAITKSHLTVTRPPSLPRIVRSQLNSGDAQKRLGGRGRAQSVEPGRILASVQFNKYSKNDDSDDLEDNRSKDTGIRTSRSDNVGTRLRDNSCSSRMLDCRNGLSCFNLQCEFCYPPTRSACEDGIDCEDFDCPSNHTYARKKPCSQGDDCKNINCEFLHPSARIGECHTGDECREWNCRPLHSANRPKPCFYKEHCYNTDCLRLHPRNRQLCASGVECSELYCPLAHPLGRKTPWDPCKAGRDCTNRNCPHTTHPSDRILQFNQTKFTRRTCQLQVPTKLKTIEQRNIDRQQKPTLPTLASKDEFCRRLIKERVLVVSAETGSGKSTQLPQYAAEYFGGLVVCTQPRVVAAISLARRVANEYDGTSVGQSVGYQVGYGGATKGHNRVPGSDIIFMTDSALIQESQNDQKLARIKVLIIDEAHERSLNTDIVLGLAKLLLNSRPTDFYVVIASATIDPVRFLNYFQQTHARALNVPGRVFDVSLEYMPRADDSIGEYEVSTVLKLYNDRPEGHILVFLPGQQEIDEVLVVFNRSTPDNCVALPLYGSLSPEEQDRVLQFDEDPTGKNRMIVFCTNVAETSLTIQNVRLVIDSGLAKEARFDPKRRLTVIETVRISNSFADQRKGRSDRTASGHCVRLYNNDELIRRNIEPEILRSSLDLVVLQLLRLRLNPWEFPFMDPPEDAVLKTSLQLLQDLDCIDMKDAIILRGELFIELGLDPRLSPFIADTCIEHGHILQLTAIIAALLTATGSLFFMGGVNKEEKQAARGCVAMGAQKHTSDLLYMASVYQKWQSVGGVDAITRTCFTCQTLIKRESSCRSCRIKHSAEHTLNNKILNMIETTANNTIKILSRTTWYSTCNTLARRRRSYDY